MRFKFSSKFLQLFFILYGSVVPECSTGVTLVLRWYSEAFRWCSPVFRCFATVPGCSVVPCSSVPGFIVCLHLPCNFVFPVWKWGAKIPQKQPKCNRDGRAKVSKIYCFINFLFWWLWILWKMSLYKPGQDRTCFFE